MYSYKNPAGLLKKSNVFFSPHIGPALCDLACGDTFDRIPENLTSYYFPKYVEHLSCGDFRQPFVFAELQPETQWYDNNFNYNHSNPWLKLREEGIASNSNFQLGVHLPISYLRMGDSNDYEKEKIRKNIRAAVDFGNSINAVYFVFHLTQNGIANNETTYKNVKEYLRETIEYLGQTDSKAYFLLENLEFPKYPATPEEMRWWYDRITEMSRQFNIKTGIMLDVAHLWKTRGDLYGMFNAGVKLPQWIVDEKEILMQPYHDLLNYTLKNKLNGVPVIAYHFGGCFENETHLIPGVKVNEEPNLTNVTVHRFYDESRELHLKNALKYIIQYYLERTCELDENLDLKFRPLYITTESYIAKHHNMMRKLTFPEIMKGVTAIRDFSMQYFDKVQYKAHKKLKMLERIIGANG